MLFTVYGEPASQTVIDEWHGGDYLWHLMLTQQGYVVASIDNRGTPAPRGRAWRRSIYGAIGVLSSAGSGGRRARAREAAPVHGLDARGCVGVERRRVDDAQPHYFSEVGYAAPLSFASISLQAWATLDEADRAALDEAGRETSEHQWAALANRLAANYARMRENSVVIDDKPPPM